MKICHFTSAHDSHDIRIFVKECSSLARAGYEVYLVAKGESREENGVHVAGLGPAPEGRRARMTGFARKAYRQALALDCEVYHFHDPELFPYGLKLKKAGKKVIFDSHEDVPAQILDKTWIPRPARRLVAWLYRSYESFAVRRLDAVVTATAYIGEQFRGRAACTVTVNNYPRLDDICFQDSTFASRNSVVCYAGGISELRGEQIMLEAVEKTDCRLMLAGDHEKQDFTRGSARISYLGQLDRAGINELYGSAVLGLCLLKPAKNYVNSQPIKMYEYMAAGLPFICSDFPAWRKVAEESGAGICVSPDDIPGIRKAIEALLNDRERAQKMGRRGRETVIRRYSWDNEARSLLALYEKLS